MVHTLRRRDGAKALPVLLHHPPAHGLVVAVPQVVHRRLQLRPGVRGVDGRGGDQVREVKLVPLLDRADAGDNELGRASKLRHRPPDLHHRALVGLPHGAAVVPHLGLHGAGAVGEGGVQKGLAAVGGPLLGALEDVEALDLIANLPVRDGSLIFHRISPVFIVIPYSIHDFRGKGKRGEQIFYSRPSSKRSAAGTRPVPAEESQICTIHPISSATAPVCIP